MRRIVLANKLKSENQFAMRSCWECNPAHERLKESPGLFVCFECGRWYMDGGYFENDIHCDEELTSEHYGIKNL